MRKITLQDVYDICKEVTKRHGISEDAALKQVSNALSQKIEKRKQQQEHPQYPQYYSNISI